MMEKTAETSAHGTAEGCGRGATPVLDAPASQGSLELEGLHPILSWRMEENALLIRSSRNLKKNILQNKTTTTQEARADDERPGQT